MDHVKAKTGLLTGTAALGPTYGALFALVLLVLLNLLFTRNFAAWNNFWNVLLQVTPTMLVAVGMTFVIATGGIDLSVGSVMAVASALAAVNLDMGVGVAILLALSVSLALGAFNGALIAGFGIQPFIVTLALLISGRGIAQVISRGGQLIPFSNPAFEYLGKGYVGPMPFQVLVMLLLIAAAVFLLRMTSFGRYLLAVGGNESAARLSGIRVHRTKIAVYAMSGTLAGLAGLVEAARLGASDAAKVGLNIELDAIAAVVGTVIGALIMQVLTTSFNMGPLGLNPLPFSWSLVSKAAIIVLAVYIQRPKTA
jgi:ribose/xylose/arabinose/galactoside ABC-type transport system permease subunit